MWRSRGPQCRLCGASREVDDLEPQGALKIVQALSGALKSLRLYPAQHPAVERQVANLCVTLNEAMGSARKPVRLGLADGTLFLDEQLFVQTSGPVEDLSRLLQALEIGGMEFLPDLTTNEVGKCLQLLSDGKCKGQALLTTFTAQGIRNVRLLLEEAGEEEEEEQEEDDDAEGQKPSEIYGRALQVVDHIFNDVRLGKIPSSQEAFQVVKSMARLTLNDPHALLALTMLKDYDNYTFTHSVNVAVIALAVGRACALNEESLRILGMGGLLHDLGKLKVDIGIITKPGKLTPQEFDEIRKHPRTGADIAEEMEDVTRDVVDIVLGHHLRFDRSGYPPNAQEREMSALADMVAIADTYDAITTHRSYQLPVTPRKAVDKLRQLSGSVLHPQFMENFINSLGRYPVGSLVRIEDGSIGLVVWVDTQQPDSVRLKMLFDMDGSAIQEEPMLELFGADAGRIVAEVNPLIKGVDVSAYFG
jgi:putative nucleotidyltransferase with HDIG domain